MGISITKESHRVYQARVTYIDEEGNRRTKAKRGLSSRKDAKEWAEEIEHKLLHGDFFSPSKGHIKLPEYFYDYVQTYKVHKIADRTYNSYLYTYRQLLDNLNIPINRVTRKSYQEFLKSIGKDLSKATMQKLHGHLKALAKEALYEGAIKKDFTYNTSINFDSNRTRKVEYLSAKELGTLTRYLEKTRDKHFTSKYILLTLIGTGMRPGEVQALQVKDVNFRESTININKTYVETTKSTKVPKNESSYRTIVVSDRLLNVLRDLITLKSKPYDYLFTNQYGTIASSSALNKTLRESLEGTNLNKKGFHAHSLRHTHVAYLIYMGVDIYSISKRLGHENIGTTQRVYSYLIDELKTKSDEDIKRFLTKI